MLADGGLVRWWPRWLSCPESTVLFDRLRTTLPLRQEQVTVFGKVRAQPRLTSWHANEGCSYRYSGLTLDPAPWTDDLCELRRRVEEETEAVFNSVLVNLYRCGSDAMGWHADDEPCFGPDPTIASVSFGGTRRFLLRHRETGEKREYPLGDGSLLVMSGTVQRFWSHAVPKTAKPVAERLNLTWRRFLESV